MGWGTASMGTAHAVREGQAGSTSACAWTTAERFIQTSIKEWANERVCERSEEKTERLGPWLGYFNQIRPPPLLITNRLSQDWQCVNNLLADNTWAHGHGPLVFIPAYMAPSSRVTRPESCTGFGEGHSARSQPRGWDKRAGGRHTSSKRFGLSIIIALTTSFSIPDEIRFFK